MHESMAILKSKLTEVQIEMSGYINEHGHIRPNKADRYRVLVYLAADLRDSMEVLRIMKDVDETMENYNRGRNRL